MFVQHFLRSCQHPSGDPRAGSPLPILWTAVTMMQDSALRSIRSVCQAQCAQALRYTMLTLYAYLDSATAFP